MCKKCFFLKIPLLIPKIKIKPKIDNAHIHIPRNNPAKFHENEMDSLGGVADMGLVYMCKK